MGFSKSEALATLDPYPIGSWHMPSLPTVPVDGCKAGLGWATGVTGPVSLPCNLRASPLHMASMCVLSGRVAFFHESSGLPGVRKQRMSLVPQFKLN